MIKKKRHTLTPKEQATTATYKLQSNEIESLKESLKKTQDELETMREKNFNREKENTILRHKQKNIVWIEVFKFASSVGVGFSTNYFFSGNYLSALTILISSFIIFTITLVSSNK